MAKRTYREKLMDPRWQKRRLEILNRDKFRCQACGDDGTTLHVHHVRYYRGRDPWAYDDGDLLTLCAPCHEDETQNRNNAEVVIIESFKTNGWSVDDMRELDIAMHLFAEFGIPARVVSLSLGVLSRSPWILIQDVWLKEARSTLTEKLYDLATLLLCDRRGIVSEPTQPGDNGETERA